MIDSLACWLVRRVGGLLCRLPPEAALALGSGLGTLACWLQPKRARVGIANLMAAFDGQMRPRQARRIILRCYREMAAGMLELLRLPVIDAPYIERYVTLDGEAYFRQALSSGRPIIFLTGHYGNWELTSIVSALKGHPIVALARMQNNLPKLYALLLSYRESKGCTIVHKGGAMKQMITALGRGRIVGIVGDQASRQGRFVDFLGRPALFATGPFSLAYGRGAVILPAFMRRRLGPHHTLVLGPPIDLAACPTEAEAIASGVGQFAAVVERHIRQAPDQWLWMHKRWKHTPARRVVILSDGKAGHVKQSQAVVAAMTPKQVRLSTRVVEVRFRHRPGRIMALLWSLLAPGGWGAEWCLRRALTTASARDVLTRWPDLIVSCGSTAAVVNRLWSRVTRAKSVAIMNPAPLPHRAFDLIIAPRHDGLSGRNVIEVPGAISPSDPARLAEAATRLPEHPKYRDTGVLGRHVAVLIGGDTQEYTLGAAFVESMIEQVLMACESLDGDCLVTTSRRTSHEVEQYVTRRLAGHARCRLLILASRDPLDGTMDGMLGACDVAIVTGESISMVSEACASGKPVIAVAAPRRTQAGGPATKHERFLRALAAERFVQLHQPDELAAAVARALTGPPPAARLDTVTGPAAAVTRLLEP